MVLGMAGSSLLFGLAAAILWALGVASANGPLLVFASVPFYLLAYWLGQRGQLRLGSYVFVLVLLLAMVVLNVDLGLGHATLVGYAMVTLAAGMLIGPSPALFFALLGAVAHLSIGVAQVTGALPTPVSPENTLLIDGVAAGFGLVTLVIFYRVSDRQMGKALQRERELGAALRTRTAQLETLRQVSQDLVALQDLDTLLHQIVERAMQLLDGEAGGIYLYRPERDLLEWTVAIGEGLAPTGTTLERGEGLSGKVWVSDQPQVVDDYATWEGRSTKWPPLPATVVAVPIQWGDQFLGVLGIQAKDGRGIFTSEEVALLTQFSTQVAIAIHNVQLYERAQKEISERVRAGEAVRESEARYRSLFDRIPVGMYRTTPAGQIVDANPSLVQMLGYPDKESLLALNVVDLYIDPENRQQEQALLEQEEVVRGVELQLRRRDGAIIRVRDNVRAIRDADGQVIYYEGSLEDITERVRLEEQLRQSQKMEAVGRLAGGIAHDFNNLLTVIRGYSELVLGFLDPDVPVYQDVQSIFQASEHAAKLTRQLLAFSRRQIAEFRVLDLNQELESMREMFRRLIGEDISLNMILSPDLGNIRADPGYIGQVLANLVVNARDAMPNGGALTIETANVELGERAVALHMGASAGPYVMLIVRDTGAGMSSEVKDHLFEPFFTTKEEGKGTGLGLSTVYGIIRQSGGFIEVDSEVGKGATFRIYLPRIGKRPAANGSMGYETVPAGKGETVLIVEDEEKVRQLAVRILERLGYAVLEAEDGVAALELCQERSKPIDLVLTDVIMPGMNGKEFVDQLRAWRDDFRVLFMSGYTGDIIADRGGLEPDIRLIQKPFDRARLAVHVRQALDGSI
jgi:PAS domain S-box-containing protein